MGKYTINDFFAGNVDCFTSADAVQAVYKRMGLKLDFGDPTNWIELEDDD